MSPDCARWQVSWLELQGEAQFSDTADLRQLYNKYNNKRVTSGSTFSEIQQANGANVNAIADDIANAVVVANTIAFANAIAMLMRKRMSLPMLLPMLLPMPVLLATGAGATQSRCMHLVCFVCYWCSLGGIRVLLNSMRGQCSTC